MFSSASTFLNLKDSYTPYVLLLLLLATYCSRLSTRRWPSCCQASSAQAKWRCSLASARDTAPYALLLTSCDTSRNAPCASK